MATPNTNVTGIATGDFLKNGSVSMTGPITVDYAGGVSSNQHLILNTVGNGQTVLGGSNGQFFVRAGTGGNYFFATWVDQRTNATGIVQRATDHLRWSSTGSATGNPDLGLERISSRLMGVNDGSTGVWGDVKLRNLESSGGVIKRAVFTVATLPNAATSGHGAMVVVTDANTTLLLGLGTTVTGGGANKVPAGSDGTNWIYGG